MGRASSPPWSQCMFFLITNIAVDWPSIKSGTWNIPEHPGTSNLIMILMRKIGKINTRPRLSNARSRHGSYTKTRNNETKPPKRLKPPKQAKRPKRKTDTIRNDQTKPRARERQNYLIFRTLSCLVKTERKRYCILVCILRVERRPKQKKKIGKW